MNSASAVRSVVATLDWDGPTATELPAGSLADATAELGEGPLRWVAGVVELGIGELLEGDDADGLAPWTEMRGVVQAHLVEILRGLLRPSDPRDGPEIFEPAIADVFARDVPLHKVLDTVATFHTRCLTMLVDHALGADVHRDALAVIVRDVTATANLWTRAYAERYLLESERRLDTTHARLRAAIEALVAGDPIDPGDARLLGIPVDGWHLGCVVAALPGTALEARSVDAVAVALARATRTGTPLRYETSTGQVWLWSSGSGTPRVPADGEIDVAPPLVVGLGRPHRGASGLRRTHLEAVDALRVVRAAGDSVAAGIDQVSLAALLSVDRERARWFVDRELVGLVGADEASRELRHTLRTFYAVRMRVAPAAERLFLHRNTLINRLDRVEGLLGHSVAERTAEVQAALILHDVLTAGDAVATGSPEA